MALILLVLADDKNDWDLICFFNTSYTPTLPRTPHRTLEHTCTHAHHHNKKNYKCDKKCIT